MLVGAASTAALSVAAPQPRSAHACARRGSHHPHLEVDPLLRRQRDRRVQRGQPRGVVDQRVALLEQVDAVGVCGGRHAVLGGWGGGGLGRGRARVLALSTGFLWLDRCKHFTKMG